MDPNWDNLRYLLALIRCESIAVAARQLNVNEITVRRRISRLEEECGLPLFERIDGTFQATAAGRQLAESAQIMEATMDGAFERLSGQDQQPFGHVRVGAPDGVGTLRVAPALAKLQAAVPELTIELVTMPRQADLARREVDVAIVPFQPTGGGDHRVRAIHMG